MSAHFLQWSSLNISHSCAHFSHIVAQIAQCAIENPPLIDIIAADIWHIMAHSTKILTQFFLAFRSGSFKHALKHSKHACAHFEQASIHACISSVLFVTIPIKTILLVFFILHGYYSRKLNLLCSHRPRETHLGWSPSRENLLSRRSGDWLWLCSSRGTAY